MSCTLYAVSAPVCWRNAVEGATYLRQTAVQASPVCALWCGLLLTAYSAAIATSGNKDTYEEAMGDLAGEAGCLLRPLVSIFDLDEMALLDDGLSQCRNIWVRI